MLIKRDIFDTVKARLARPQSFIQVLAGARQVGKSTLARQVAQELGSLNVIASADDTANSGREWLSGQWQQARGLISPQNQQPLLVLDEVQKVPDWSEVVKRLWDEDRATGRDVRVLLLGSAPLLMTHGLAESLAGRFELVRVPHWSFGEMQRAFGVSLDDYIYWGGYPGAAALTAEPDRWASYIRDAMIDTTVSRDVLMLQKVAKPALLRRVFELGASYAGQILAYQKMLGQLKDAGNTTTLAHYLELLKTAGLIEGFEKFSLGKTRTRASSPKLSVRNTALLTAIARRSFAEVRADPHAWGRYVEAAVGAHLGNLAFAHDLELFYWRERNHEVDFILRRGEQLAAIEVKSGKTPTSLPGMKAFLAQYPKARPWLVGEQGYDLGTFLRLPISELF